MSDVVERADDALQLWSTALFVPASKAQGLVSELLVELEAARAEAEREHLLFTQTAEAVNRQISEARQAGYVEGRAEVEHWRVKAEEYRFDNRGDW